MVTPDCQDYTCSICLEVLNMPVVLSCTHRFCHSCLSKASSSLCNHSCPLCKKEIDLDPHNYEIDPVRQLGTSQGSGGAGHQTVHQTDPGHQTVPPRCPAPCAVHRLILDNSSLAGAQPFCQGAFQAFEDIDAHQAVAVACGHDRRRRQRELAPPPQQRKGAQTPDFSFAQQVSRSNPAVSRRQLFLERGLWAPR